MVSTALKTDAKNVHNIETKRKSVIEGREFAPTLWVFLKSKKFSSTALILLSVLAKDSGYRDSIYTLEKLGDIINKGPDTVKLLLALLRKMGMIETKKAPKNAGLIITRTNLWDIDCPDELRRAIDDYMTKKRSGKKLPDSQVKNSPTPDFYHYIKNNKKDTPTHQTKPPENTPPDPPKKPQKKHEPPAVFFHKNTKEKLGPYHKSIAQYCAIIITMNGYNDKLNPIRLIKWALSKHMNPKAIDDSLKYVVSFKSLSDVDPYAVMMNRHKVKTQKYNAKDEEGKNDELKSTAIKNGKIVLLMKGI